MGNSNPVKPVSTDGAPAAIGPYSQGAMAGPFLFISGQIPLDPDTGEMVGGTIEDMTHRVLKNIKAIVEAAGAGLGNVVKTTVFLKDMGDFVAMNGVYAEYFQATLPARAAVQVAALPKDADIEIEAVVYVSEK